MWGVLVFQMPTASERRWQAVNIGYIILPESEAAGLLSDLMDTLESPILYLGSPVSYLPHK